MSRIEFSPELEHLLKVLARKSKGAHTAIMYKYIEENELEGTELLDLLSNSSMVKNNPSFFNDVIHKDWSKKIQKLITDYENGDLQLNNSELEKLKTKIKVLRFNEYFEGKDENNPQRYNFDYTQRPQKYLILNDDILAESYRNIKITSGSIDASNVEGTKQINEEGITAYICRAKDSAKLKNANGEYFFCLNKIIPPQVLRENAAHSRDGDRDIGFKISGHDGAWVLLFDKKNKQDLGCLRFEYYSKKEGQDLNSQNYGYDHSSEDNRITISDDEIDLIIAIINEVLIKRGKSSYSELYSCLDPILRELMEIGLVLRKKNIRIKDEELKTIKSVHALIVHLFYVFKRNTYYGELIYDRINKFIEALLKQIDVNEEIFIALWGSLRKQEDLMLYDLENYRDHFIHQFHVFITGYIFIHKFGIENICKLLDGSKIENSENIGGKNKFTKTDVLRIWVLSSLFHDCGYSFEKLSKGYETFSNNIIRVKLQSNFQWDKLILEGDDIAENLQKVAKYFNLCPQNKNLFNEADLFRILLKKAILDNDHGVISSIILKQQYKNCKKEKSIPLINSIINISASAIALHNKPVFTHLSEKSNQRICFYRNPFAFILAYFDTAQEWGRKKSDKQNNLISSPKLSDIIFVNEEFTMNLEYSRSDDYIRPNIEFINENLSKVKTSFFSGTNLKFKINYNVCGDDNSDIIFQTCGEDCEYRKICSVAKKSPNLSISKGNKKS